MRHTGPTNSRKRRPNQKQILMVPAIKKNGLPPIMITFMWPMKIFIPIDLANNNIGFRLRFILESIMKKIVLLLTVSAGFCFSLNHAFAQQGIHASGGNASGTGGSVSYSVGQVFYSSQSSSSGTLVQGVQQPFELVVTEVKSSVNALVKCEAFPNPAIKDLKIRISGEMAENATWRILDLKGVTVLNGNLNQSETIVSLADLPMAAYSLQIFSGEKEMQSFKVIKQ